MIEYLRGRLAERGPDWVVLDVGGIGFRVSVPATTLADLPGEGEVRLWTHYHVREDVRAIYGFSTASDRDVFLLLLGVNGVGPRIALAALSLLPADRLAAAVEAGDEGALARVPGVGRKTAQRMVLDLKGKLSAAGGAAAAGPASPTSGEGLVVDALTSLGLSRAEVAAALATLPADGARSDEETLRLALQAHYNRAAG
jgi:holliday junction DNA helicase RuvA